MRKALPIFALVLILCLPISALAAGKATITQETFYVTPFLDYHAGELYCELTNTGDKPVKVESGVYEFFDPQGESVDSGSIYTIYPRVLLPGEKGYIALQSSVKEAVSTDYLDDYTVSVVGKSASEDQVIRYPVSDVSLAPQGKYGFYQAFFATVTNPSDVKTGDIEVVFAAYDADGKLLYACHRSTSGISLLPGNSVEVYCTVDDDVLKQLESEGIAIATIEAIAYEE